MTIQDLAFNPLADGSAASMLGYSEPAALEDTQLEMYRFIIEGIRIADQKDGRLFLKRFLEGPQAIWGQLQERIFAALKLWSVTECPDEYLVYLKQIVGWTPSLARITDGLDDQTLRRLIGTSVRLWKERGTEDAMEDVIRLTTAARLRVWNYFDFRWIIGETGCGHEDDGDDPWIIDLEPGVDETDNAYVFNLRIVDGGSLDRALVRNLVKLMRPSNERVEINYLHFMDLFQVDADNSQWAGSVLTVADGVASLSTTAAGGVALATVDVLGAELWDEYIVSARVRGSGNGIVGLAAFVQADGATYALAFVPDSGWGFIIWDGATINDIPSDIDPGVELGTALADTWYTLRIHLSPDVGGTRIRGYVDGVAVASGVDATYTEGTVGLLALPIVDANIECDMIEVMGLPAQSDFIDINSD